MESIVRTNFTALPHCHLFRVTTEKQLTGRLCSGLTKKWDKQNNSHNTTTTTTTTEKQSLLKPILGCSSQAQRIEIEFCGFSIIKVFPWTNILHLVGILRQKFCYDKLFHVKNHDRRYHIKGLL